MAAAAAAGAAANTVVTTSSTSLSLAVSSPLSIGFVADLLGAPANPPRHRAPVDAASVSGEPPLMGALRAGHWAAAAALVDVDAAVFSKTPTVVREHTSPFADPNTGPQTPAGLASRAGQAALIDAITRRRMEVAEASS